MRALINEAKELNKYSELLFKMVRREIATRNAGTLLGVFWSYFQPLVTVATYFFIFDYVFKMRLSGDHSKVSVGSYLVVGTLPWIAFVDYVGRSMNSLVDAGSLLQKNSLPPVVFVLKSVVASAVIYLPITIGVSMLYGEIHHYSFVLLLLLPLLLVHLIFSFLLGYFLALIVAAFRDMQQIVGFIFSLGIFAAPILFEFGQYPESMRWILWLNPMTPYVLSFQSILLHGSLPELNYGWIIIAWLLGMAGVLNLILPRGKENLVDWV
jgi:lipopolysaccharide transport system permease protein